MLHLFIADLFVKQKDIFTNPFSSLKLVVFHVDELINYTVYSQEFDNAGVYKFNQTIHVPLKFDEQVGNVHHFQFAIVGSDETGDTVRLGSAQFTLSANDKNMTKIIDILDGDDDESDDIVAELLITIFRSATSIDIDDIPNLKPNHMHNKQKRDENTVKEYAFLIARRCHRPFQANDHPVTFDESTEERINRHVQAYVPSSTVQQASPRTSIPIMGEPKKHPKKLAASKQKKPEAPKLRKTCMAVGFVNNTWPETNNNNQAMDQEKKAFQLRLARARQLELLKEIAVEMKARNQVRKLQKQQQVDKSKESGDLLQHQQQQQYHKSKHDHLVRYQVLTKEFLAKEQEIQELKIWLAKHNKGSSSSKIPVVKKKKGNMVSQASPSSPSSLLLQQQTELITKTTAIAKRRERQSNHKQQQLQPRQQPTRPSHSANISSSNNRLLTTLCTMMSQQATIHSP